MRDAGLFDELAVELVPQGSEVEAGLQDALDERHGLSLRLQLLHAVKESDGFLSNGHVAFTA